jgi:hypothetical protein
MCSSRKQGTAKTSKLMKKNDVKYQPVMESAIATLEAIALRELEIARNLAVDPATPRHLKDLARETLAVARSLRKLSEAAGRDAGSRSGAA